MIKAVIFDMDGLMIDSEPIHYQAFKKVFSEFGKAFPEEDNSKYIGISDIDEAKEMIPKYNFPLSPEELVLRKQAAFRELIEHSVIPKEGLYELLQKLQEGNYKMAIASSSSLDEIALVIKNLDVNKYIKIYVSAQQAKKGKPAPDVFLFAAQKLGVSPSECLVLEDAPNGVKAAFAAGMKCFAIPGNETKSGDFSKATRILGSLKEVMELIG